MDSYQYLPLQHGDSIRLLRLLPGPRTAPLNIDLFEVQLQENLTYEALSYTWATESGDASLSSIVICDGAIIPVTMNCEAALRRQRQEDGHRTLWVDAICICQTDIAERSRQVGLMRDVYGKAIEVLIWLGEASHRVDARTNAPYSDIFLTHLGPMVAETRKVHGSGYAGSYSSLYADLLEADSEPIDGFEFFLGHKADPLLLGLESYHRAAMVAAHLGGPRGFTRISRNSHMWRAECCVQRFCGLYGMHQL
jgi:hypothetical protein